MKCEICHQYKYTTKEIPWLDYHILCATCKKQAIKLTSVLNYMDYEDILTIFKWYEQSKIK